MVRGEFDIREWSRCQRCESTGPPGCTLSLLRDNSVIRQLRYVLLDFTWPVDRLTNRQVVDLASHLLASGRLHICRTAKQRRETGGGSPPAAERSEPVYVPVAPRRQVASSPAPKVEDVLVFSDSLAAAAQARVLLEAAEFGIPFCEECQRELAAARGESS